MNYPNHISNIIISDPFILSDQATHKYYTYAADFLGLPNTQPKTKGNGFYALVSEDLLHWSNPILVFEQGDFWGGLDYWAPECHLWKGNYYIFSTFRAEGTYRACQCLVADSPLGPFRPMKNEPVTPKGWQCLDGTLYIDKAEKPWMVFCHEWVQVYDGQVAAVPLSDDLSEAIGDPIILFRASDAPWGGNFVKKSEKSHNGNVTDGPFLHRMKNGTLIMLWSNFTNDGYATGYARSAWGEIQGPWIQEANPLYALDGAHSMLFYTFDGQLMMSLHSPNAHTKKRILLFQMVEDGDRLHIINEITGNWNNQVFSIASKKDKKKNVTAKEQIKNNVADANTDATTDAN
ncbi:MAG: glycoside hydrolase family 43 protein [Mobilitalea sp.]